MTRRNALQTILVFLGTALLCAGLFFDISAMAAQIVTPTPDRLAQPTLPLQPTQADLGAQVYWLQCLPCHGDRGQGLTDEFRKTYPEEEQDCWKSGCHGKNPYESGFTIPTYVPPLIGKGTLQKFGNAATLRAYIQAAMPYWKPGSMTKEESWQVTAFLLRENGLWDGRADLTSENAAAILLGPPAVPTPTDVKFASGLQSGSLSVFVALAAAVIFLFFWKFFSKRSKA